MVEGDELALTQVVRYNGAMADETTPPLPVPKPASRIAPIAIWSVVLAILFFIGGWLFAAIPAVICGHIAWSQIRKSGEALRGKEIATVGLILGYIGLALGVLGIPLLVSMIQSEHERLHRLDIERKEIASEDGKLKVTTSGFWVKRSDPDECNISCAQFIHLGRSSPAFGAATRRSKHIVWHSSDLP